MFSPRRVLTALAVLAGSLLVLSLSSAQQDKQEESKGEKVNFITVDGVKIHGVFYAGNKRNSPTVMMLHALGENSRKQPWVALAETLNGQGYSVLTFDFRGHGISGADSKTVDPELFWGKARNVSDVKGAAKKSALVEFTEMKPSYYPVLVNDIAAAKAFLDNRNDAGACNTSSLVVLGAEEGATLGALWLNAEWHRYAFTPANILMGMPASIAKNSEGKDTIAAIWLSASPKLGSRSINLATLLDVASRQYATPTLFMFSDKDESGKKLANSYVKTFKGAKKDAKYDLTMAVPVPGAEKLKGAGLLTASLEADKNIADYIKAVAESKGNEWTEHDFRKTQYIWRVPGTTQTSPCKLPNEKLLLYDTYERFLPR